MNAQVTSASWPLRWAEFWQIADVCELLTMDSLTFHKRYWLPQISREARTSAAVTDALRIRTFSKYTEPCAEWRRVSAAAGLPAIFQSIYKRLQIADRPFIERLESHIPFVWAIFSSSLDTRSDNVFICSHLDVPLRCTRSGKRKWQEIGIRNHIMCGEIVSDRMKAEWKNEWNFAKSLTEHVAVAKNEHGFVCVCSYKRLHVSKALFSICFGFLSWSIAACATCWTICRFGLIDFWMFNSNFNWSGNLDI